MNNAILKKREAGFSLLELMIAMTVFLIVIGAIYGLLRVGSIDRNRSSRRSDALKNARLSLHLIGRDALNAGLGYTRYGAFTPDDFLQNRLGFAADPDVTRDLLTSVVAGNNVNTINLQAGKTDMIAFTYRDLDFFNGNTIQVTDAAPATSGSNTVRLTTSANILASGNPAGTIVPAIHDLYLAESDSSRVVVMLTGIPANNKLDFAPGDPLTINQSLNGSVPNGINLLRKCVTGSITTNCMNYPVTLKRVFLVTYKIKADGTLVRTLYGNNTGQNAAAQIQEQPIAYGVRDMQIRYTTYQGISTNDPSLDSAGAFSPTGQNDIRQVSITLNAQDGIDDATGNPIYVTVDGTFSTRNLEYDAG